MNPVDAKAASFKSFVVAADTIASLPKIPATQVRSNGGPGLAAAVAQVTPVTKSRLAPVMADSFAARLFLRAKEMPEAPAYHAKVDGKWVTTNWQDYAGNVRTVAKSLIALGLEKGDSTCIYSYNRPEWLLASIGTTSIGTISASADPDHQPDVVAHVIDDAAAKVVFVENLAMFNKIAGVIDGRESVEHIVILSGEKPAHPKAMTWTEFNAKGASVSDDDRRERELAVRSNECSTLIYTSGTTGAPKGAMLSHANLAYAGDAFVETGGITKDDSIMCFLRLTHVAEQMFIPGGSLSSGMQVYFSSAKTIKDDMLHARPTVLFGVPKVWDALINAIQTKIDEVAGTGFKRKVVDFFRWAGARMTRRRDSGQIPYAFGSLTAGAVLFDPAKRAAGLDRLRLAISGAAPLSKSTFDSMGRLGVSIYNAYGQTEATGVIASNRPGHNASDSLGLVPARTDVKIDDETGEILVRGPGVFMGYRNNDAATAETLKDGWLRTGDMGKLEGDTLYYLGRMKRSFKLENGMFVNPEPSEAALQGGIIQDVVVVGSGKSAVGALVVLNYDLAKSIAADKSKPLHLDPKVLEAVRDRVGSSCTRVKYFSIIDRPLNGDEVTTTGKLKPKVIEQSFAAAIDAMYAKDKK